MFNYSHVLGWQPFSWDTGQLFLRLYFFESSFKFAEKLRGRYRDFSSALCPHICIASPSTSSTRMACLLQLLSLHWCIIITQSPGFTVHPPCCIYYRFRQIIMTKIHHYSIIHGMFTALKILCVPLVIPPSHPWQPLIFENLFFFFFLKKELYLS